MLCQKCSDLCSVGTTEGLGSIKTLFPEENSVKFDCLSQMAICLSCLSNLSQFVDLSSKLDNFKADLHNKLTVLLQSGRGIALRTRPQRKKAGKVPQEEVEIDEEATTTTEVFELNAGEKNVDGIQRVLAINFARCCFAKASLKEDKYLTHCLTKLCGLTVNINVDPKTRSLRVQKSGSACHVDGEDPQRRIFELTKQEFALEHFCEYCCQYLEEDSKLNKHLDGHLEDRLYTCLGCDEVFKTFQVRNSHFLVKHSTDAPYECSGQQCCGGAKMRFKTKYKLSEHERKCVQGLRYPCDKCDKTFTTMRNLRDHVNVVHNREESKWYYSCPHCTKRFYKKSNLDNHVLKHTGDKPFACVHQGCDVRFKRAKSLKAHLASKHSGKQQSYLCSFCGKPFASLSGYKQHLSKHTGVTYLKRNVVCTDCGKAFRSRADLRTHSVMHTKEKAYTCHTCSASFTQKASLKDHQHVHMNTWQCELCKKSFGRQRYLDQHVKGCGQSSKEKATQENQRVIEATNIVLATNHDEADTESENVHCVHILQQDLDQEHHGLSVVEEQPGQVSIVQTSDAASVLAHFNEKGTLMLEYSTATTTSDLQ